MPFFRRAAAPFENSPKWRRPILPSRRMRLGSVCCRMSYRANSIKKEKSHVVDYHCNSGNPVAARLFGWKHKSKVPENRQLDSHSHRYCHHPNRSERVGDHLDSRFVEKQKRRPILAVSSCFWSIVFRPANPESAGDACGSLLACTAPLMESPPSGGDQHSPADGCCRGVFLVL